MRNPLQVEFQMEVLDGPPRGERRKRPIAATHHRYGSPTPVDRLPVAVVEPGAEEGSEVEEREGAGSESR